MSGILDDIMGSATALNDFGTGLQVGGQIMGAVSHFQFGQQAQVAGNFQAAQLRDLANTEAATSQRRAFDVDRQSRYIASAALASAAGSGGGASDPTVVNIISNISAEGAYRGAVALYGGQDRARLMQIQAATKEYEGNTTAQRSNTAGAAQLLGAGTSMAKGFAKNSSLLARFGGGGPQVNRSAPMAVDVGDDF